MKFTRTKTPDVILIEPKVFGDARGYFMETFRQDAFEAFIGHQVTFCQDNEAKSSKGVLRGLHYQLPPFSQGKLVRVTKGSVLDIAVDIRKNSPTFGQYVAVELSEENKKQLFVPRGFAHGYVALENETVFSYKTDNYYSKAHERGIKFNDPVLKIDWKLPAEALVLSEKDKEQPLLKDADIF